MADSRIDLHGWHFVTTPIGDRFGIWVDAPDCCALQVYLDSGFRDHVEVLTNQTLATLAIGAHGQALGYGMKPYSEAAVTPAADDDGIATYLQRPHQPYGGPFLEFYFLTCDPLTLVPIHVWKGLVRIALEHHTAIARLRNQSFPDALAPEELRQGLLHFGIVLQYRDFDGHRIGILNSGTVRYVRLLDPEMEALNWLYLYIERLVPPFGHALGFIRNRQDFHASGIHCVPNSGMESEWTVSVEWVEKAVVIAQGRLLRILDYLMHAD